MSINLLHALGIDTSQILAKAHEHTAGKTGTPTGPVAEPFDLEVMLAAATTEVNARTSILVQYAHQETKISVTNALDRLESLRHSNFGWEHHSVIGIISSDNSLTWNIRKPAPTSFVLRDGTPLLTFVSDTEIRFHLRNLIKLALKDAWRPFGKVLKTIWYGERGNGSQASTSSS